jgi:hypothetical protein
MNRSPNAPNLFRPSSRLIGAGLACLLFLALVAGVLRSPPSNGVLLPLGNALSRLRLPGSAIVPAPGRGAVESDAQVHGDAGVLAKSAGAPASAVPASPDRAVGFASTGQALPPLSPIASVERMIVKTGSITLQVTDLHLAIQRISAVVDGMPGAYVAASSTSYHGDPSPTTGIAPAPRGILPPAPPPGQSATVVLRVPSDAFGDTIRRLREIGTPFSEQISTQEVTEEYVDLEAQARALEATEQQYLRLLERANRIEEILPIQQRLMEVRSNIDRLRGRMNLLQRRADMSNITVSLVLPSQASTSALSGEPRAVQTLRAAIASLALVGQGVLDVLIYVAVYIAPIVPLLLLYRWWRTRSEPAARATPSAGGAV